MPTTGFQLWDQCRQGGSVRKWLQFRDAGLAEPVNRPGENGLDYIFHRG